MAPESTATAARALIRAARSSRPCRVQSAPYFALRLCRLWRRRVPLPRPRSSLAELPFWRWGRPRRSPRGTHSLRWRAGLHRGRRRRSWRVRRWPDTIHRAALAFVERGDSFRYGSDYLARIGHDRTGWCDWISQRGIRRPRAHRTSASSTSFNLHPKRSRRSPTLANRHRRPARRSDTKAARPAWLPLTHGEIVLLPSSRSVTSRNLLRPLLRESWT